MDQPLTKTAKRILTRSLEIYTEFGKNQYFTARYASGETRLGSSTQRAVAQLVELGWLETAKVESGETNVLGYMPGLGRPPKAYRLLPKKARSVGKALA